MSAGSGERAWRGIYAGIAVTTMATLLLELALTRIFSVVLYYHFAFMAISVALFGLGVGAVFSYYLTGRAGGATPWKRLGWLSTLAGLATVLALETVLRQAVTIQISLRNASKLALIYFITAIPFCLAGAVISLAISASMERVERAYFFDLLGACVGCLLLVPLLDLTGGTSTVLAAAALYGAAGAVWFGLGQMHRAQAASWICSAAMIILLIGNISYRWVDVRFAKGAAVDREVFSRWNSFSRVAVKESNPGDEPVIVIDADAATSIAGYSGDGLREADREGLLRCGPGLAYRIRPGAKALVIGPGGGYDIVRALAGGSRDVTGVEINPIIVNDIMKGRFAEYSHRLYLRPEVKIHIEDGRSWVRRMPQKFQVIQMTLVDTWASTAAGAFALSENNLYTTEAFVDYLEHLTDDGVLSITRWEFDPPRESLRVVSLAIEALRRLGVREPWRHFAIGREKVEALTGYGALDTVLVKRTPLEAQEVSLARRAMAEARMPVVYLPGERAANPFAELLGAADPLRYAEGYSYDITPVSDNRPFFFYTVRARDLWGFVTGRESEDVKINLGVMVLFALLAVSLVATLIILLLPALVLGSRVPREPGLFVHLGYFVAIGAGFILVEVALIQKFVLFLGNPTYSLTVVVFSLLLATGVGSYWSRRVLAEDDRRLMLALAGAAAAAALLGVAAPPLLSGGVGLPKVAKFAITGLLLAPAGFLMGMGFPSGLKRLEKRHPAAIRWAWAVNSASSVLGSVGAIFLAIHLGLTQTLLAGGGAYLVALGVVIATREQPNCSPKRFSVSVAS